MLSHVVNITQKIALESCVVGSAKFSFILVFIVSDDTCYDMRFHVSVRNACSGVYEIKKV